MTWRGIDAHAHLATSAHWSRRQIDSWFTPLGIDPAVMDVVPEELIADYDRADILFGVALALDARRGIGIHVPNDYVARICAASAGRLVGFGSVDPLGSGAQESLAEAVELGLVGLKLAPTYQDFHPRDEAALHVFAACEAHGLPVLIHQGGTVHEAANPDLQDVGDIEFLAQTFPGLDLIVAHMAQPAERQLVDIMSRCANVFADISGLDSEGFGPGRSAVMSLLLEARERGVASRIFWGSDNPWSTPSRSLASWQDAFAAGSGGGVDEAGLAELGSGVLFDNMHAFATAHGWRPAETAA